VTGRRSCNLVRAAKARSRVILINETNSRPSVNRQPSTKSCKLMVSGPAALPPPKPSDFAAFNPVGRDAFLNGGQVTDNGPLGGRGLGCRTTPWRLHQPSIPRR
jgi:hypothetical protein